MNIFKWINKNCKSLKGKQVIITGATGGLGKEICFLLAGLEANICIACRNKKLADKLISEIKQKYKNVNIDFVELDLSSIKSIKDCITKIKKYNGIDILINNAGIYNVPLKKLELGFNNIFQINFVSTYFLTKQLIPELEKKENSVCITVSSIAHNYSKIDENDIDFSTKKRPSKIYGNSKRFLTFSFLHLFQHSKTRLAIVHPGITLTNMTSHYPKAINWIIKFGVKILFPSPQKASLNILYALDNSHKQNEWIGPSIFNIWGKPKIKKLYTSKQSEQNKIFEIAENIYKKIN